MIKLGNLANLKNTEHEMRYDSQLSILIPFSDDSTLFFALRMAQRLRDAAPQISIKLGLVYEENVLSARQLDQLLPNGPDLVLEGESAFKKALTSGEFKAVVISRVYKTLRDSLVYARTLDTPHRACVIAFLGGLDFFPERGRYRRRMCDAVFLFPRSEIDEFKHSAMHWPDCAVRELGFGHPTFTMPKKLSKTELTKRRDIYFFAQALSPSTRRARLHMLRAMAAIALANPDQTIWIKLRHLPNENKAHLHREVHDYPSLIKELPVQPDNLKLTACTIDEALETAGLGITCTSTAAIDVIREGVPCMVHLDYVDNYLDPLVVPMQRLFDGSGLITSLEDMLHLRTQLVNDSWVGKMFCPDDLGERVLDAVTRYSRSIRS